MTMLMASAHQYATEILKEGSVIYITNKRDIMEEEKGLLILTEGPPFGKQLEILVGSSRVLACSTLFQLLYVVDNHYDSDENYHWTGRQMNLEALYEQFGRLYVYRYVYTDLLSWVPTGT